METQTVSSQPTPKGNRKQRRKQAVFNRLLNRSLNKASELGQVSVQIGPDGVPHVTVKKNKLLAEAREQLKELKKNPDVLVHGPGMEGLGPRPLQEDDRVLVGPPPSAQALRDLLEGNIVRGKELEKVLNQLMALE
jgi:hypothetical protein